MKTSILIDTTTASGNKGRKTITDVNPNATNAAVKSFAQQLVALTTDTYGSTSKVNIGALQPASALQTLHVEWWLMVTDGEGNFDESNVLTVSRSDLINGDKNGIGIAVPEDHGLEIINLLSKPATAATNIGYNDILDGFRNFYIGFAVPTENELGDFVFQIPETDKYAAFTFIVRVTA